MLVLVFVLVFVLVLLRVSLLPKTSLSPKGWRYRYAHSSSKSGPPGRGCACFSRKSATPIHACARSSRKSSPPTRGRAYTVVIINWVQYLGPPGPSSFPDSRDLLEVLGDFLGRERGGVPRGSSRTLGDPPWGLSLCQDSPPRTSRRSRESGKEKGPGGPR